MTNEHLTTTERNGLSAILQAMNEVWGFHDHWNAEGSVVTRCLAFVVDDRFIVDPEYGGEQFRVGASFGENPFTMDMKRGFVSPHPLPSRYVLGLHVVGTDGREIRLYDTWAAGPFDADASGGDQASGEAMARTLLESVSDERYALLADPGCFKRRVLPIAGRSPYPLEQVVVKYDTQP
jgi:hypothetical protein